MVRPRIYSEDDIPADLRQLPRECPREDCKSLDLRFMSFIRGHSLGFTRPRYLCNDCGKEFILGGILSGDFIGMKPKPDRRTSEYDEETPADDESNSEAQEAEGERQEDIDAPEETDSEAEDEGTPAPSNRGFIDMDRPLRLRKGLLITKIKEHLSNVEVALTQLIAEIDALKADHPYRPDKVPWRRMNRELLEAGGEREKTQRDKFVAASRKLKAENGKIYEYTNFRYNLLRGREASVTKAELGVKTFRRRISWVENMDIDSVRHVDLVKFEKRALQLLDRVHRLEQN